MGSKGGLGEAAVMDAMGQSAVASPLFPYRPADHERFRPHRGSVAAGTLPHAAGRARSARVTPLWDGLEQDMIDKGVIKKKGEFIESFSASILLGYPSKPNDLAGIAAFLASRDSDYITGQVIMSDGGMVLV